MDLEQLIAAFDSAVGLEQAQAADGVWKFSADGHVFGVMADDSGENVFLFGEVAAPPPDREEAFRKAVLEANFFMRGTCGAVFSMNPESGAYTLMKSLPLASATVEDFLTFVEKFVNTLATWKDISNATQQAAAVDAPQEPPEAPAELSPEMSGGADDEATASFRDMLRV